jgi:hypothetical protein
MNDRQPSPKYIAMHDSPVKPIQLIIERMRDVHRSFNQSNQYWVLAAPIPREPPVTSATLPASVVVMMYSFGCITAKLATYLPIGTY